MCVRFCFGAFREPSHGRLCLSGRAPREARGSTSGLQRSVSAVRQDGCVTQGPIISIIILHSHYIIVIRSNQCIHQNSNAILIC